MKKSPQRVKIKLVIGESPSGKATASGAVIRRFESFLPSHEVKRSCHQDRFLTDRKHILQGLMVGRKVLALVTLVRLPAEGRTVSRGRSPFYSKPVGGNPSPETK